MISVYWIRRDSGFGPRWSNLRVYGDHDGIRLSIHVGPLVLLWLW